MTIQRTTNQQPKLKGGNNMTTKYVTLLTNYDNRQIRKDIKLKPPYQINTIPYTKMKERYNTTISIMKQLRQGTPNQQTQQLLTNQLKKQIGDKLTNYALYRIYNEEKVITKQFKEQIKEAIYNKVIYWNIYKNNSRLFLTIINEEDISYETSTSININKYFHPQEEQFIKALMDTKATLVIKDINQSKLLKYKTKKGDHDWDYKNYQWNELIKDIINHTAQAELSPEATIKEQERYRELQTKYSNLETSQRLQLTDYNTAHYINYQPTIRKVDIQTYLFLKEKGALELKIDKDKIERQLNYLKNHIKNLHSKDKALSLILFNLYEKLDSTLSREYALEEQVGYNPEMG